MVGARHRRRRADAIHRHGDHRHRQPRSEAGGELGCGSRHRARGQRVVRSRGQRSTARSTRRRRTSTRAFAAPRAVAWRRTASFPRFPTCCTNANGCSGPGLASGSHRQRRRRQPQLLRDRADVLNPGAAVGEQLQSRHRRASAPIPEPRHYVGLIRPGDAFYRVTVRVEGPRNTVTYAQAMLK